MNRYITILCFIARIYLIYSQTSCIDSNPINRYDCFKYSTSNLRCCFDHTTPKCFPEDSFDAITKQLDCGAVEEISASYAFTSYRPNQKIAGIEFMSCGITNPDHKSKCTDYSHLMNSCCLFKTSSESGCFYIGKRYTGSKPSETFSINSNEYTFECSSSIISYFLANLLLYFLIIFL